MIMATIADFQDENLPYYDSAMGEMTGGQAYKARRYIRDKLVQKANECMWIIKPIPNHSHQSHIVKNEANSFTCDCQNSRIKHNVCSHIQAVILFEKRTASSKDNPPEGIETTRD